MRILISAILLMTLLASAVWAQGSDIEALNAKIAELEGKVKETQKEADTLSAAVANLDNRIRLTEAQIAKTEAEIVLLESQITNLGYRLDGLEVNLTELSTLLIDRVQEQYKRQEGAWLRVLAGSGLWDGLQVAKYMSQTRSSLQDMLVRTESKRQEYDQQKSDKEDKQADVEALQDKLQAQQKSLANERREKNDLLAVTRNSEAQYQKLLSEALSELNSFSSFARSRSSGKLLPPQNSPDGWFFSQLDERWGNNCIGRSCGTKYEGTIADVGCLVSSVSMVKKKFGENVNPAGIAAGPYFFSSTALMLRPWPAPSGYYYTFGRYDNGRVESELREGRPVILKLKANNSAGTHFIVLKSGSHDSYVMHDPIEGYDKPFKQFYSHGQILEVAYLQKS